MPGTAETTALTPAEEQRFQSWAKTNQLPDVDHPESHYDYRGFWKATGGAPHPPGSTQHFPDTFKQHGHPTFSIESQYSKGPNDGGHWEGDRYVPQKSTTPTASASTNKGPATYLEFAKAIRQTHPGSFDDVPDDELAQAVLDLHPDLVGEIAPPPRRIPQAGTIRKPAAPPPPGGTPLTRDPAEDLPAEGQGGYTTADLKKIPGVPGMVASGKQAYRGATGLATGTAKTHGGRAAAVADVVEGTLGALGPPLMAGTALVAPEALPALAGGTAAGELVSAAGRKLAAVTGYTTAHPGRARLAADVAGLAAGGYAGHRLAPLGEVVSGWRAGDSAAPPPPPPAAAAPADGGDFLTAADYQRAAQARGGVVPTDYAAPPPPPPVAAPAQGTTRLYRAGGAGNWFTDSLENARQYQQTRPGPLHYVDVPTDYVEANKLPGSIAAELKLPPEHAGRAQVLRDFAAPTSAAQPKQLPPARRGAVGTGSRRVYPSDATPQLDIVGDGPPPIAAGGTTGQPPPPAIDQLSDAIEQSLLAPQRRAPRLNTEKGIQLEYDGPPLPQQPGLNLKPRKGAMRNAVAGVGADSIAQSPGGALTEPPQMRLADIPADAAPPPPPLVEPAGGSPTGWPNFGRIAPRYEVDPTAAQGLRWIAAELDQFRFHQSHTTTSWEGEGLSDTFHPREAGAPVYHDILQVAGRDATRGELEAAIAAGLRGDALDKGEGELFEAARRVGLAWQAASAGGRRSPRYSMVEALNGSHHVLQEHALLPPEAGALPDHIARLHTLADELESSAGESPEQLTAAQQELMAAAGAPAASSTLHPPSGVKPYAIAAGVQPGFGGPDIPLYNIVGGPAHGSTVSAAGLRQYGIPPPDPAGKFPVPGGAGFVKKFFNDEGFFVFDIPPGDPIGLKKFLKKNEQEYGTEPWFSKATAALASGDHTRAWRLVAAASVRSIAQAGMTGDKRIDDQLGGMAAARIKGRTTRVGNTTVVEGPPVPPGMRGQDLKQGAGGTLITPRPKRPVPLVASDRQLGRQFTNALIEGADPTKIVLHPEMKIRDLQASAQIAEQILLGDIPTGELQRLTGMSRLEVATQFRTAMSHAGSQLGKLGNWVQQHSEEITLLKAIAGGAPEGDRTLQVLTERNFAADRVRALYHAIGRPVRAAMEAGQPEFAQRDLSLLGGISNATIPMMISQPATFVRNFAGQMLRYSVAALDQAVSAGFAAMAGAPDEAKFHWNVAQELGRASLRPGNVRNPLSAAEQSLQGIFDLTAESWKDLPKNDIRRSLRLMLELPDGVHPELVNFLGNVGGEDTGQYLKIKQSEVPVLKQGVEAVNAFLDPAVQNKVTALNRWQEFAIRAPIFDATLRAHMLAAGHDPDTLLGLGGEELRQQVGARNFDRWIVDAASQSLDWTFASRTLPGSIPDTILRIFGDLPALKIGYPFPRFDLVATMRFLYDHSPVALVDNVFRGVPYAFGGRPRTRLQMGMVAKDIGEKFIPELDQKITAQMDRLGQALQDLNDAHGNVRRLVTQSKRLAAEGTVEQMRSKLDVARMEHEAARNKADALRSTLEQQRQQAGLLPDSMAADQDALTQAIADTQQHRSTISTLERQLAHREEAPIPPAEELKDTLDHAVATTNAHAATYKDAQKAIKWLEIQQGWLEKGYRNYKAIGAPTIPEFIGRQLVGTLGIFGGAYAIRSSAGADGTEWYQYRMGPDSVVDLRPYGPFVQTLFVADVIRDHQLHTDWPKVVQDVNGLDNANPFAWTDAIRQHYDGKYSNAKLGREFAHAFLTISKAAGVTLTLADFATRWATGEAAGTDAFTDMILGTVGQLLARATIPLRPVKDLLATAFPSEAVVRMADRPGEEQPFSPLAAPLQNVPGVSQLIPPQISQITGQPLTSQNPLGRQFAGLSISHQNALQKMFTELGVLPESIYIHRTGEKGLDDQLALEYSKQISTNPAMISLLDPTGPFMSLSSIGLKREVLSSVLSGVKQLAIYNVRQMLGVEATTPNFQSPTQAQRIVRWQKELDRMEGDLPPAPPLPEFTPSVPPEGPPTPPQ